MNFLLLDDEIRGDLIISATIFGEHACHMTSRYHPIKRRSGGLDVVNPNRE